MYGLLLENLATFIKAQWGEGKWESVRRHAGIDLVAFSIHHVYPETLMRRIARSAFQVLGVDERQFFKAMGVYFVQYVSQYGYDQLLSVLGRHLRDFLNGLDNLHEYLKFSYPKMRAPSFYCDDETESGLKLHYRSKRRGFVYYVMGQIKQVAKQFYNQECNIHLITEEVVGETIHVVFELAFDNSAFSEAEQLRTQIGKDLRLPVRASTLFELFPFCIVFNSEMEITHTGHTLMTILKDLVGQVMTEAFDMTRPLIPFCFAAIMQRRNNIFELVTVAPIHDVNQFFGSIDSVEQEKEAEGTRLRLRGQMLYMEDWNMMLYLANPVMPDLNGLVDCSLFINDLSLHDCSRDLVLAGTQQSVELKLALDQEQQKSRKLVQSMKKLDEEMKRTDELLYQMIPKQVADRIRNGENPVETCQTFESVSILFTDVVNFTDICSQITPLQVVSMLNHMYFLFDQLTERNGVYKVETVGDSYMVVSGAPVSNINHAERICDMAMDIIDASEAIDDPSGRENGLRVRVGCHSGAVVAGVVGIKMPRYCLFGDTVNTASRMESTSEPGKIQISEACRNLLSTLYTFELRGTVNVKGKGEMYTYWLLAREARVPLSKYYSKTIIWTAPTAKLLDGIGRPTSPNSHKPIDRNESIVVVSPPSSGTTACKYQRVAATYKSPSLGVRPQLQFKFDRTSTNAATAITTNELIRASAIPMSLSNRTMSSPELQRMSKVGNRRSLEELESDDNIQLYFNKNAETKRREASMSFLEKLRQNKIQPTSVYDSDLIKEAFQSHLGGKVKNDKTWTPPASVSPKPGMKSEEKSLSAEAAMIIAGILPHQCLPTSQHIITGMGECGQLPEYTRLQVLKLATSNSDIPTTYDSKIQAIPNSDMGSRSEDEYSISDSTIKTGSAEDKCQVNVISQVLAVKKREKTSICEILEKIPYTRHIEDVKVNCLHATDTDVPQIDYTNARKSLKDFSFATPGGCVLNAKTDAFRDPKSKSIESREQKKVESKKLVPLTCFDEDDFTESKPFTRAPPVKTKNASPIKVSDQKQVSPLEDDELTCTRANSMKTAAELPVAGALKRMPINKPTSSYRKDKDCERHAPLRIIQEDNDFEEMSKPGRARPVKTTMGKKNESTEDMPALNETEFKMSESVISDEEDTEFKSIQRASSARILMGVINDAEKVEEALQISDDNIVTKTSADKLNEVRVEKWIREEFAEAKNSITAEDSDGESSTSHFSQVCNEIWIQDEENWIGDDEFAEVFIKDKQSQCKVSEKGNATPGGSTKSDSQSGQQMIEDSNMNPTSKTVNTKATTAKVKEIKNTDEKNDFSKSSCTSLNNKSIQRLSLGSSKADTRTPFNKLDRSPISELATTWENKVIARSWQITHPEGPEFQQVVIPSSNFLLQAQSKKIPQVKTLCELSQLENIEMAPGTNAQDTRFKIETNSSKSSTTAQNKYHVFSSEFRKIPILSPQLAKTINKNCTKYCYDCLSIASVVDNESDSGIVEHPLGGHNMRVMKVQKPQSPKVARTTSKEVPIKRKIFKLFNRTSFSDEGNARPQ